VWATADSNKVLKIDAKSGNLLAVYPVGDEVGDIAAYGGQAIFMNYDSSFKIGRITTNGKLEQTKIEGVFGLATWDGKFWATYGQGVFPVSADTGVAGTQIQTTDVGELAWREAAYLGNSVACLPKGSTAVFVNLKTASIEGEVDFSSKVPKLETALSNIAAGEGSVWILAYNGTTMDGKRVLIQIDPTTKTVGKTLEFDWTANADDDVLAANGYVWITREDGTQVIRVDPKTVKQVDTVELGGVAQNIDGPGPMAFGAGAVWVADFRGRRICRIDNKTTAVACIALNYSPKTVAVE